MADLCRECGIRLDMDGLCQCPEVLLAEIERLRGSPAVDYTALASRVRLVNERRSCPGKVVAISADDANESARLLSAPSTFANEWHSRFRQIGPLVFERSAEGWELHLGNGISLTLPDGPLFSGDYPADVQKDVLLKSLADAGYTMGREHVRLSGEIRSLRAKLMRERADAHELRSKLEYVEGTELNRDGLTDMAALCFDLNERFLARARRLRAEAERVEGGQ